ncbi:MAG: hypothetical protein ACT4ON_07625 [Bacteroidota bacterium]
MKNLLSLFAALLFGTLLITSCAKEDPEPVTPDNSDPRARLIGNWFVSESSSDYPPPPYTYNCSITDSSNASYIFLSYLYGFTKKTYATVNGNNFTIPTQLIEGKNVSGTGVLTSANRISLNYLVQKTTTDYDTVRAVLTK